MKILYFVLLLAIFTYSTDSSAAISVTIVDAPESTLVYAPVQITAAIENIGNITEAVQITDGWDVEIGQANQYLPYSEDYQGDVGEHFVAILHPGEKYYVSKSLGPQFTNEGIFEVRVIISGFGHCIPHRLSKPYSLERIPTPEGTRAVYKCWSGKVHSRPVKIAVMNPAFEEDREVLEFVRSGQAFKLRATPGDWSQPHPTAVNFAHSYRFLLEKYPNNYYTFVAGLYASAASLGGHPHLLIKEVLDLQPQHPLREYALIKLAMEQIDRNLPLEKRIESDLPPSMKQFIEQHRDEVVQSKRERQ